MVLETLYALAAVATVCGFLYEVAKDARRAIKARRKSSRRRMTQEGEEVRPPRNR